jgi:hypothetical protein
MMTTESAPLNSIDTKSMNILSVVEHIPTEPATPSEEQRAMLPLSLSLPSEILGELLAWKVDKQAY